MNLILGLCLTQSNQTALTTLKKSHKSYVLPKKNPYMLFISILANNFMFWEIFLLGYESVTFLDDSAFFGMFL